MAVIGILAGGIGSRLGASLPKQFLEINKKPIIIRTIEKFIKINECNIIYIAMNKDWMAYCYNLIDVWNINKDKIKIIEGGITRFDSMNKLLDAAILDGYEKDVMIVHDCARPFVPISVIKNVLEQKKNYDMVTASIKTIDTILESVDGCISNSMPNRNYIYQDQGPQAFNIKQLKGLINNMSEDDKNNAIEAGRVYLDNNLTVGIVQGDRFSFKITNKIDLLIAETLVRELGDNL